MKGKLLGMCTVDTCSSEVLDADGGLNGHTIGCHACERREIIMVNTLQSIEWLH